MDGVNMSITATNNTAFFLNLRNNYEDIIPNYTIPDYHSEVSGIACGAAVSSVGGHFWGAAVGGIFDGISLKTDGFSKNKDTATDQMPKELLQKIHQKEENLDIYKDIVSYCIEKNIDEVTLYTKAFVSKAGFSKIRSMKTTGYRPSKSTIICLCLALNLNLKQTQELLNKAGYMLSNDIFIDKIVAYCIEANFFNIYEIESLLSEKMQRPVLFKA